MNSSRLKIVHGKYWLKRAFIKDCFEGKLVAIRAVVFRLFPKTVNLPQKPVGYRVTFIQYLDIIF